MLSAIAARKAAQAANLAATSQPFSSTPGDVLISESESESGSEGLKTVIQKSKRKSSDTVNLKRPTDRKKRRKNSAKIEAAQPRYYDTIEAFPQPVEQDEGPLSSASDSDEDIQELQFADTELREIIEAQQPQKTKTQRAWSPSRPPGNSSDEGAELSAPTPHFPFAPGSRTERLRGAKYQTAYSLSFVPQPEKNVFYIEKNDTQSVLGRKGTVITLVEGETTALLGVYSLTVLRGRVSLMGTKLHASASRPYTIFAPKCSPIPVVTAVPSSGISSFPLPDRITHAIEPSGTILFLEDVHTGVEGLGLICKTFENVFDASSLGEDTLRLSGARVLTTIPRSLQVFHIPDSWRNALAALPSGLSENGDVDLEPLTLLVRGQKRTGKSTFARTLLNRLICRYRRVAYLECDIGQTEFTPSGLVSLHVIDRPMFGPPFTHPLIPYASHFIGASSPKDSPVYYLTSVSTLLQTYKLELQYPAPEDEFYDSDSEDNRIVDVIPLVVNTMGWLKGLGADLARRIEELVAPTNIFMTRSEGSVADRDLRMEPLAFPTVSPDGTHSARSRTLEVEAISPSTQAARYTAADWRTLSLMSYFHSAPSTTQYRALPECTELPDPVDLDPREPLCTWKCQLPLVAQIPYSISPAEAIDNVILVGAGMEDVVPSEIARVLNGAVVALVSCDANLAGSYPQAISLAGLPYTQAAAPPDPSASNCIGLALVRSLSPSLLASEGQRNSENGVIHLLTPVPLALIVATSARCFVKGEIELPIWGMLDYREFEHGDPRAHKISGVPYLQWSKSEAIGAERRKVRRNIMRKGQM
ncbi:GRC3 [Sanghuangporus weigelae]